MTATQEMIEAAALKWATMDRKKDRFLADKAGDLVDDGTYEGYCEEARQIVEAALSAMGGEPVAWQHRFQFHTGTWSCWMNGKVPSRALDGALKTEERPVYATPPVPAVKVNTGYLEEAIRLAEIGEYLHNRSYSYGDGRTEPREYGIEWQWQQSKPNEFGEGVLLAESTQWHKDMAEDGIITEATKLRTAISYLDITPSPAEERMRKALSWYAEQARLCRLIHSGGDAGRHALADDGGKRARTALEGKDDG